MADAKQTVKELKRALTIDKHDLDRELLRQPQLNYTASELCITAKAERDRLKADMDNLYAELDEQVREAANGDKLKEREIKSRVMNKPKMQEMQSEYLAVKHQADLLEALRDSIQSRAYSMRDLSLLYTSEYYSSDSGTKTRRMRR